MQWLHEYSKTILVYSYFFYGCLMKIGPWYEVKVDVCVPFLKHLSLLCDKWHFVMIIYQCFSFSVSAKVGYLYNNIFFRKIDSVFKSIIWWTKWISWIIVALKTPDIGRYLWISFWRSCSRFSVILMWHCLWCVYDNPLVMVSWEMKTLTSL